MRSSPLLLAFVLLTCLSGCPSGEPGDDDDSTEDRIDNSVTSLDCPEPDSLPFPTETAEWVAPSTEEQLAGTVPGYGGLDLLGVQSGQVVVEGIMGRNDRFNTDPIVGEWVSVWNWTTADGWAELGRGQTDFTDEGTYSINADASAFGTPDGESSRFYSILEGAGHCADHGVFAWPPGTQVIVTDIDGTLTLSDDELTTQLGDPTYVPQHYTDAPEMVQAWIAKGYRAVYLTARPHPLRSLTRPWLDDFNFPYGPVSTAPELVFGGTAADYKADFVNRLQNELGWDVVVAYGNAGSDIAGYEGAGIPKDRTFIIGPNAGDSDTVAITGDGWTEHIAEFIANFPDAD